MSANFVDLDPLPVPDMPSDVAVDSLIHSGIDEFEGIPVRVHEGFLSIFMLDGTLVCLPMSDRLLWNLKKYEELESFIKGLVEVDSIKKVLGVPHVYFKANRKGEIDSFGINYHDGWRVTATTIANLSAQAKGCLYVEGKPYAIRDSEGDSCYVSNKAPHHFFVQGSDGEIAVLVLGFVKNKSALKEGVKGTTSIVGLELKSITRGENKGLYRVTKVYPLAEDLTYNQES